jgi:hypothetical protein
MDDDPVRDACEDCFDDHEDDCSGFLRAVAEELGIAVAGLANEIVDTIRAGGPWTPLADGTAAEAAAANGKFVIAGLRGAEQTQPDEHGHVVVIVAGGPLAQDRFPFAYWGRLGGGGERNQTINFAWRHPDCDNVTYAAHEIPAS